MKPKNLICTRDTISFTKGVSYKNISKNRQVIVIDDEGDEHQLSGTYLYTNFKIKY